MDPTRPTTRPQADALVATIKVRRDPDTDFAFALTPAGDVLAWAPCAACAAHDALVALTGGGGCLPGRARVVIDMDPGLTVLGFGHEAQHPDPPSPKPRPRRRRPRGEDIQA